MIRIELINNRDPVDKLSITTVDAAELHSNQPLQITH
jgi:hypothetical protein